MLALSDLGPLRPLVDIGVVLGVGVVASLVMASLRLPAVTGLLLAGALCGPYGLKLVQDEATIDVLAEVGVVLLLFTIGLEFPLSRFVRIGKPLLVGGGLQVGLTVLAAFGVGRAAGLGTGTALALAFAVALSSTAIVLRGLSERGEIDAPHGRFIVGTLLFQDLCVIPMMLALPLLAGTGSAGDLVLDAARSLGLAAAAVLVTYVVARRLLPALLRGVDRTRSREIFILAILGICIGIALATGVAGLSLALGAFLAGIVIADSPFAGRALTDVTPIRDLLTGLFFISLGMLFDVRVALEQPVLVLGLFLALFVGKATLATIAALFMRFPARAALIAGFGLAQFGEFGFVLLRVASSKDLGLVDMAAEGRLVSAPAILTMFVTPLVLRFSPHLAAGARLLRPLERLLGARGIDEPAPTEAGLAGHVVIAGYGVSGHTTAGALRTVGIPFVVLEMNAETVRRAREAGEPVYYADVTSDEALRHARLEHARAFLLTINDPAAARRAIETVRRVAPAVPIIVRARYLSERASLTEAGASDVVAAELESTVEIMARLLRLMDVPRNVIDREVALVRERTQASARAPALPRKRLSDVEALAGLKVETYRVLAGDHAVGKSLSELHLRSATGATVIAVQRGTRVLDVPVPGDVFAEGDVLYLLGALEQVSAALRFLEDGPAGGP